MTPSAEVRIAALEADLRAHRGRMRRTGIVLAVACVTAGIVAPIVSAYLGLVSLIALVGLIVAIDMLVRATRGDRRHGDLELLLTNRRITAAHAGQPPHVVDQPVLGGQAFPDHLQLVAGTPPRLVQIEIPYDGRRDDILARVRTQAVVPDRPPIARHLAFALVVVPAVVLVAFGLWRLALHLALAGVVGALQRLDPPIGLALFFGLALVGAAIFIRRLTRRPGPPA